jgi:high-affinity iron transporter
MLAAALIVFREVLEAALVVSIVMAATRGLPHRGRWVSIGILGGVAGAACVAALTNIIASLFNGSGQDIVNAAILFTAVGLIGWHVVWMNSHGRKIAAELRAVGRSVAEGEKHMSILAVVVGLAVLREGSEVVLMLQGLWSTGAASAMIGGSVLGVILGVAAGTVLYAGFVALPVARVFALTNGILVLIAAGMAAHGANFLAQAGLVSPLGGRLWDTSRVLSDQSLLGETLAALVGYIARPNGIEALFYGVTVVAIALLMWIAHRRTVLHPEFNKPLSA